MADSTLTITKSDVYEEVAKTTAYIGAKNKLADSDCIVAITKTINGGTNGLESRRKFLARAKKVFKV